MHLISNKQNIQLIMYERNWILVHHTSQPRYQ